MELRSKINLGWLYVRLDGGPRWRRRRGSTGSVRPRLARGEHLFYFPFLSFPSLVPNIANHARKKTKNNRAELQSAGPIYTPLNTTPSTL